MEELWSRLMEQLLGRAEGPMNFRLLMQPIMAIALAAKDGVADAKSEKHPYFWSLFTHPETRAVQIREGWKSIGKVAVAAIILDIVYQFIAFHRMTPGHGLIIALILAILPYLIFRGFVTRTMTSFGKKT